MRTNFNYPSCCTVLLSTKIIISLRTNPCNRKGLLQKLTHMKNNTTRWATVAFAAVALIFSAKNSSAQIVGANIIKFNVTSFATNHYMFQYERVLSPKHSIAIGIGFSSGADIPFKSKLLEQTDGNEDAINAIESTTFDKLTITPEYRFYTGSKEAPIGFYVAPFMRYMHMSSDQVYPFTTGDGVYHEIPVVGTFDCFGAGAMIGIQWSLGKSLTLDWWILGPFYGIQDGSFFGTGDLTGYTVQDGIDLEADIESIDIGLWTIDATVAGIGTTQGTVDATVNGPYVGLRAFGFALGFRF